jgi:[ribosomal protein S5]-alanine N-acetyltransferase
VKKELKIIAEQILLRYVTHDDCGKMLELNKSSLEFYKSLVNPLLDAESFKLYVDRNLEEANECFIICRKDDNKIVGAINLSQIFRKAFQNAYLGYSLGVNFTGKGYMSETVELILQHAFENLQLHRIEANVQPHNLASIKVLQRCGFTKEGFSRKYLKIDDVWCDHERWAIILEDWRARK